MSASARRHHRPAHARAARTSREFDHVIVLCYSDELDAQRADARTLVTLLHLRDIASKTRREVHGDRQRDARRPQPPARRGHAGRRRDRLRQGHLSLAARADLGEPPPGGRVRRAVRRRRAPSSTCAPPRSTSSSARHTTFRTLVEAARSAARPRSATAAPTQAHDATAAFGVRSTRSKSTTDHAPRRATASSCWRSTDAPPLAARHRRDRPPPRRLRRRRRRRQEDDHDHGGSATASRPRRASSPRAPAPATPPRSRTTSRRASSSPTAASAPRSTASRSRTTATTSSRRT